jgi:hypothetical protein
MTEPVVKRPCAKNRINDYVTSLRFRDTIGFGSMRSNDILEESLLDVHDYHGLILVHKCVSGSLRVGGTERYREGGHKDLEYFKRKVNGLDFNKHLLLVITHTGHLSEETKNAYTQEIRTKVLPEVPADKIIHSNFHKLEELNEYERELYEHTAQDEFFKLFTKLMEFEDEIGLGWSFGQ